MFIFLKKPPHLRAEGTDVLLGDGVAEERVVLLLRLEGGFEGCTLGGVSQGGFGGSGSGRSVTGAVRAGSDDSCYNMLIFSEFNQ